MEDMAIEGVVEDLLAELEREGEVIGWSLDGLVKVLYFGGRLLDGTICFSLRLISSWHNGGCGVQSKIC
jgi:hypothetical protein